MLLLKPGAIQLYLNLSPMLKRLDTYVRCIIIFFWNLFWYVVMHKVLSGCVIYLRYYLQITWNSRNMLLSVAKDAYLDNCFKQHITHWNIFFTVYSLSIILKILTAKPPSCSPFSFTQVYGSCPLSKWRLSKWRDMHFLWAWQAHFSIIQLYNARKVG